MYHILMFFCMYVRTGVGICALQASLCTTLETDLLEKAFAAMDVDTQQSVNKTNVRVFKYSDSRRCCY